MGAATLPRGEVSITIRHEHVDLDRFSDAQLEAFGAADIHADSTDSLDSTTLSTAYGITDNVTVGLRIPYIMRRNIREPEEDGGMVEVENEGDADGLGDLVLFGQWRFWQSQEHELSVAAVGGVKMPTGKDDVRTREGGRFETEHQPGSGSWDPLAGMAATKSYGRFSLHASVLYTFATEGAQDADLGDRAEISAAAVYRFGGPADTGKLHSHSDPAGEHVHEHGAAEPNVSGLRPSLDVMLELNGEWQEKITINGDRDPNSGGTILYVSPGARLNVTPQLSLFGSVGIPVAQDVNGENHETDLRLIGGVSVAF